MKVVREDNRLIISETDNFDPKSTFECGQVFRFKEIANNDYIIYSQDKSARVYKDNDNTIIKTQEIDYFYSYFDLNTDYANIINSLSKFEELQKPLVYGKGIRILRQDLCESILSFIISANNNIPRIKGIIDRLCEFKGDRKNDFYAFPKLEQLQDVSIEEYRNLGCGFRDRYLFNTVKQLTDNFLQELKSLPTDAVSKKLLMLSGVGQKVADCIMLFGLYRTDSYPVDTWIMKANKIEELNTPTKVRDYYINRYGELSGFAQQYIFYYDRENSKT